VGDETVKTTRVGYDPNALWDDPYDHLSERRAYGRARIPLMSRISVETDEPGVFSIGPGVMRNISAGGASVVTKHDLEPGNHLKITIDTRQYPHDLILPNKFVGSATVLRVKPRKGRSIRVGLAFGPEFTESMEFAMFVDHLQDMAALRNQKALTHPFVPQPAAALEPPDAETQAAPESRH
jgi:hypothetical protein